MSTDRSAGLLDRIRDGIDRDHLVVGWLLPGAVAVVTMAVVFGIVFAVLFFNEPLIAEQWYGVAFMFVVPHLVGGALFGWRHGTRLGAPVAAGLAPVLVFAVGMLLHGGPVLTPVRSLELTVGAVAGWATLFMTGMLAGARLLGQR